jgi:RNA polymerase sigma-70 factor (ECF subfamily)
LRRQRSEQARLGVIGADLATDSLDRESDLDQRIEAEWTTYVANLAMERIRGQFQGRAIEVFELGLDGVPLEEICARTGLTTASAYTLRKRVKKRLFQEIRALINDLEP